MVSLSECTKYGSVLLAIVMGMLLGGCVSGLTASNYERQETRALQMVQFGEVVELETVQVDGAYASVGTVAGAAVGGVSGSTIGSGKESRLAAVIGALTGGALGNYTARKTTQANAINVTVRLDNGRYVSVVQQMELGVSLRVGDRVKVLSQGRTSRVVRTR